VAKTTDKVTILIVQGEMWMAAHGENYADARMLNYSVTVHRECVASFDAEAHEFTLKEM
jgi:nicotinamidase-related amidase